VEAPLRRNREFVALWVGQAVSNLGIGISSFAYPLVVLAATGSALRAGTVGTVLAATAFVLRLPAGALVDRLPRKRVLVFCDLGRAVNSGGLAAALALGHFWYAHVLAVAFVEAALGVLFGPAETAAVRRVVGPERVREAVAANASRASLPGVIGPPLGGVLLAVAARCPSSPTRRATPPRSPAFSPCERRSGPTAPRRRPPRVRSRRSSTASVGSSATRSCARSSSFSCGSGWRSDRSASCCSCLHETPAPGRVRSG
jgi:hypothetical protein